MRNKLEIISKLSDTFPQMFFLSNDVEDYKKTWGINVGHKYNSYKVVCTQNFKVNTEFTFYDLSILFCVGINYDRKTIVIYRQVVDDIILELDGPWKEDVEEMFDSWEKIIPKEVQNNREKREREIEEAKKFFAKNRGEGAQEEENV